MQAQPINGAEVRVEVPIADYLPFGTHITDHIVSLNSGDYLRTWKIGGISFETADSFDIWVRHNGFNQFVRSLGTGQVALWSHKLRRKVSDRMKGKFPTKFAHDLNEKYFDSFVGYRMMANNLYLTTIYRPNAHDGGVARMFNKLGTSLEQREKEEAEAITFMNDLAFQVESSLKKYDVEALSIYTYQPEALALSVVAGAPPRSFLCSQVLELFGYLVNGVWERVPVRNAKISEYLPTSRLFFGNENIEIRTATETRFASVLDFADYPKFAEPGILNPILYDNYEYIEAQSYTILSKYDALAALKRQKSQLIASEDIAVGQIKAINTAMEEVVNGTYVMGDYHYSLSIFGESVEDVRKNVAKARTALNDQGFQTALVDLVPDSAWWAQLPGNWRYRPRAAQISSRAFCGLSSFHNFATGKRDGNPWGEAITCLKTPSGQPLYVNLHVTPEDEDSEDKKALGNTGIIGQAGSGKTALELFLLFQMTKYGYTGVIFDKDRGCELGVRQMGGKYFVIKRGVPTGLAPLKSEPTPQNIAFWESLIKKLVEHASSPLTAKDDADIAHAVRANASMPKNLRGITAVYQNLNNMETNSIKERLKKWTWGQANGWLLDNPEDKQDYSTHKIFGYDCTEFLEDQEVCTPLMMDLLYRTSGLIDGRRFVYVMAEFWKLIMNAAFEYFAKDQQKTIRKRNGLGIYDTQSPADALDSPIARALVEQWATVFFLPNPKAQASDYIDGFKCTKAEYEIIRSLPESSRMFLIKQGHRSAIGKLDLNGFDDEMLILSSTTDNVELLDEIMAEIGEDPDVWLPEFYKRVHERRAATRLAFKA